MADPAAAVAGAGLVVTIVSFAFHVGLLAAPLFLLAHVVDEGPYSLLDEGDLARVWNDRGEAIVPVQLNPGIRPGVVHVIEGRCVAEDPWLNLVTDDAVTDMGYGATFYECLVEVGPV